MKTAARVAWVTFYIILSAFFLWFFLSFVDVATDNTTPEPKHSDSNIFVLLAEGGPEQ